jgi:hypothetical protein
VGGDCRPGQPSPPGWAEGAGGGLAHVGQLVDGPTKPRRRLLPGGRLVGWQEGVGLLVSWLQHGAGIPCWRGGGDVGDKGVGEGRGCAGGPGGSRPSIQACERGRPRGVSRWRRSHRARGSACGGGDASVREDRAGHSASSIETFSTRPLTGRKCPLHCPSTIPPLPMPPQEQAHAISPISPSPFNAVPPSFTAWRCF